MDIGIFIYVEEYKIIDQRNTYPVKKCLPFKKEIGQEGYRYKPLVISVMFYFFLKTVNSLDT